MPLTLGTRLGPYEITGHLGKGGMGEVYRAKDTKLDREVAIKVLPPSLARDPERLSRFEREAKVLASLNHPHIATIYSLEESAEGKAIAMELVDGTTLKSPLPLDTALNYAKQVAEALEAAHEKGVTHRDLKPANIMVTPAGVVKVLDFGLAAVTRPAAGHSSDSPTLTMGMTEAGMIMGTAAYMAPEQAVGGHVDRRADIWSFGVVLWQMLSGKNLFGGETVAHVLANVINTPIDFGRLPDTTPKPIRELLKRCLDRDVKNRLQAIGEARVAIQMYLAHPESETESPAQADSPPHRGSKIPWAVAGLMTAAAAFAAWGWLAPAASGPRPVTHFVTPMPQGVGTTPIAISRDGSRIAFGGAPGAPIYVRAMDDPIARPIPGTEGGQFPAFSPDGQWIAFFTGLGGQQNQLKKVPISGGAALTLNSAVTSTTPMTWNDDNTILWGGADIRRISDAGGEPAVIAELKEGEAGLLVPHPLPGGQYILASVLTAKGLADLTLTAIDVKTGERKPLLEGVGAGKFVASGDDPNVGHLVYGRNGSVFAATFNANTLQAGSPAPVVEGVMGAAGLVVFGVSPSGMLSYVSGGAASLLPPSLLVWVDRQGAEQPVAAPARAYNSGPRISPDGTRVAMNIVDLSTTVDIQVWVHDLVRGSTSRRTFEGLNGSPVWTPKSERLIYASGSFGSAKGTLSSVAADGSGQPAALQGEGLQIVPESVSPDGKMLIGTRAGAAGQAGNEVFLLPLDGSDQDKQAKPHPLFDSRFKRSGFEFSPDGKWLAYQSNETGRSEVYVEPYPGPGGRSQVSTGGGTVPRWNRNGKELFFRSGDKMMAVDVETGAAFRAGTPKILFEKESAFYDVAPDGRRFLMLKTAPATQGGTPSELHVVVNWFEELRRRVPLAK